MDLTDLDLLDFTARLYDPMQCSYWNHVFSDLGCYCAVKYLPDGDSVLVFRGSVNMLDWWNDLDETPYRDTQLGDVHRGFFLGVRARFDTVMATLTGQTFVTGHSLGAARAFLFGALMMANGPAPKAIIGFGLPRPGFKQLSGIIAAHPNARWYRNRIDQVTFVPWRLGDFVHPGEKRLLDAAPAPGDSWGPLADHHLELYRAGLVKLNVAKPVA